MFKPSLEEFKKLSKSGNLIPVYKEILADLDTPVSAYMKISDGEDYSFNQENNNEKEMGVFDNGNSNNINEAKELKVKEPEMFEEPDLEEDFEIPAFLRRQKN